MSVPAFGLYPSRGLVPAQRVTAGRVVQLDTPVDDAGVKRFRTSYWLPVPPLVVTAQALRLVASQLQIRFAPIRFDVGTGSLAWFPAVDSLSADEVRIDFAWPAQVVRVPRPAGQSRHAIKLLRADGDAVADDATMSGLTGVDLDEPWLGSPLVVRVSAAVADLDAARDIAPVGKSHAAAPGLVARAAAPSAPGAKATAPVGGIAMLHAASALVPSLTLAGSPTSPRIRLLAEQPSGTLLLWQALLPGEQGTVTLPAQPVGDEWAPALEQLRRLAAEAATAPALLRLDIESDAPCTVTFTQLQLALQAEIELLMQPQKLAFGGDRPEEVLLPLDLPAGLAAAALRLSGRVVADGDADAAGGTVPVDGRQGALLAADQVAVQPVELAEPVSLAGLSVYWQPLSDTLRVGLRLCADGGNGPGARVLVERTLSFDTPRGGWIAVRWPAIDLQAQRVWVEWALLEGAGLWLFSGAGAAGWIETRGVVAARQALPQGLLCAAIPAGAEGASTRPIAVRIDGQTVVAALPADVLALEVPQAMLPLLANHPIVFVGGVRGSVTVESARWVVAA